MQDASKLLSFGICLIYILPLFLFLLFFYNLATMDGTLRGWVRKILWCFVFALIPRTAIACFVSFIAFAFTNGARFPD